MDTDGSSALEIDDEAYETKAIKAYLANEISFADLEASLELKRAQVRRLVARFKVSGQEGLKSKKMGVRNRAYSETFREHVIGIIREQYLDFGPTLAAEKLEKDHGIRIATETLRGWMKEEGIWVDRRGRKPKVFSPRKPREQRGELIQVDGSYHRWFEKRGDEACLLVFIDDATSEIMLLRLVDHESSYNYMACLRAYIHKFGCPLALYSDRHSIFRVNRENGAGERTITQFTRACRSLDIKVICAKTPQAKGRVERANRTLQDRLVKELRLRSISTVVEANAYFEEYRLEHNRKFARLPENPVDAHLPKPNEGLDKLLTYTVQRKVFKDLPLSFNKMRLILEDTDLSRMAIGKIVTVAMMLEGDIEIIFDETPLPFRIFDKIRRISDESPEVVDHKRLGAALAMAKAVKRRSNGTPDRRRRRTPLRI
ncbi:ISNCY family transposase [Sphingopyxis sp.]|uniref:ISNCY family transposase n=1 Tax=Sphingopyxis sp. TaxID=1908224 RepID=UPI003BA95F1D